MLVHQDGRYLDESEVRLSPLSPLVQYGYSLYETIRTESGGRTFRLPRHVKRMQTSASLLRLPPPPGVEEIREAARRLCEENGIETGRLRLVLASLEIEGRSTFLASVSPWSPPSEEDLSAGWEGRRVPFPRLSGAPSSGHKGGHGLDSLLFRSSLRPAEEGIFLNESDRLCEGVYTNLFVVRGDAASTPPLADGCLPGVTREAVLELAGPSAVPMEEVSMGWKALAECEEAFLTNALMGVVPLTGVDGAPLGNGRPGPVTKRLCAAYLELVRRELM